MGKMKGTIFETIPESRPTTTSSGQPSTFEPKKSELLERTIKSHVNMLAHLYKQQQLLELHLQGIQKQCEEITTLVEVMKKSMDEDFLLSMSDEEDIEGEYMDPIPSPILNSSPDSIPKTEVTLISTIKT